MKSRLAARPISCSLAPLAIAMLIACGIAGAHDVALDGDIEIPEGSDAYVNVGGEALRTGGGECLKLGGFSEESQVNACEGIEEEVVAESEPEPEPAPAPEVVEKEPTIEVVSLDAETLFTVNSADLGAESEQALADLIVQLDNYQEISSIGVVGHTDATGSESYNQTLSEQRAQSVQAFLQASYPDVSITARGEGENSPVATNSTKEGRRMNRRVEIEVSAKSITDA